MERTNSDGSVNCSGHVEYKCRDSDLKISNCGVRLQIHVTVPFFVHEVQTNCGVRLQIHVTVPFFVHEVQTNCGVRLQIHVAVPFFVHEVQTNFCYGV